MSAKTKSSGSSSSFVNTSQKMKSVILYPYGPLTGNGCCRIFNAKNLAITSAIYTVNISLLIVFLYSWRISVNIRRSEELQDVYYGVQIAYFAIIGTQIFMIVLSVILLVGINKENYGLIVPWIIGFLTFMSLEAVAMVYSNVLRDHVNKQFDGLCKAEVAFFVTRALINVIAMWGVMRFFNLVRAGITWNGPEAKIALTRAHRSSVQRRELRRKRQEKLATIPAEHLKSGYCSFTYDFEDIYDYDSQLSDDYYDIIDEDDDYTSDEYDEDNPESNKLLYDYQENNSAAEPVDSATIVCVKKSNEDTENDSDCPMLIGHNTFATASATKHKHQSSTKSSKTRANNCNNNICPVLLNKRHNKYRIAQPQAKLEVINESERSTGSGSEEHDSLLIAFDGMPPLTSV